MASIIHFNIAAEDPQKMMEFYKKLFGWETVPLPGPETYYMVTTKDINGKTGIGGGISKKEKGQQSGIINYIGVSSLEESLDQIKKLGGKVIQPRQAVPGYGFLALCADPEENLFGIFEESKTIT